MRDLKMALLILVIFLLSIVIAAAANKIVTAINEKQIILKIENLNYDIAASPGSNICLPGEGDSQDDSRTRN